MTRRVLPVLALLLVPMVGCADRTTEDEPPLDSTPSAVTPEVPENPKVTAFEVGLAIADDGRLLGGGTEQFQSPESLFVWVQTQFVDAAAPMTVRLMQGERVLESVSIRAGVPDPERIAHASAPLQGSGELTPGEYRVEVLLGDVSQGIRTITITE